MSGCWRLIAVPGKIITKAPVTQAQRPVTDPHFLLEKIFIFFSYLAKASLLLLQSPTVCMKMKNLTPNTTYLRNSALKHSFRLKVVAFETCCLQLWGPSLKVSLLHFQRALAFLNLYFHFWVVKCFQTNTINYRPLWESANNQSSHQVIIVAAPSLKLISPNMRAISRNI